MRGAFKSAGVDMSDDAWATVIAVHLARCGGDASVHTAHSWFVTAHAEIISKVHGALGVWVEVLTDPTISVKLPHGNDGLPADVGVLYYHGIRSSKLAFDAMVSCLFGVSSPPPLDVTLCRAKKTNFEKYRTGEESPDTRFIPFCGKGIYLGLSADTPRFFFIDLARQTAASKKGMHVGKWLASWRRRFLSPSMPLTRTTSCAGSPPPRTIWRPLLPRLGYLLLPRRSSLAPRAASVSVIPRAVREVSRVASTCCASKRCEGVSCVLMCFMC
jgi:hypothetical protein